MSYTVDTKPEKLLKAQDVGRYFIYLSNKDQSKITNKKLQKLVYYAQAWSLALNDKKLFTDPIEAWVHGPAVRTLYARYKIFGFEPIVETVNDVDIDKITNSIRKLLDEIWRIYGKLDAEYLEMLTHSEAPWQNAREGLQIDENSTNEILPFAMQNFYAGKLKDAKKKR